MAHDQKGAYGKQEMEVEWKLEMENRYGKWKRKQIWKYSLFAAIVLARFARYRLFVPTHPSF